MVVSRTVETARFVAHTYRTLHLLKARRIPPSVAGGRLAAGAAAMGPLYVKMSQFISARRDALDAEFVEALAVVQDRVPAAEEAQPPCMEGYVFDPVPIARASIADVFRGVRLADNATVVAKCRRAGVKEQVERDLPLLYNTMAAASLVNLPGARNMCELVRESESMVRAELDFRVEAAAQREFAGLMGDVPWVVVPRVVRATEEVLVSEYVPSRRVTEVAAPNAALATRLMDLYMSMLDRGFVHADPHPGNIGILPHGRIVLYDFGAMLRVEPDVKPKVAKLLQAGVTGDADGVTGALESLGVITIRANQRTAVRRIVRRLLADRAGVHRELQNSPEFAGSDTRTRVVTFGQTFIYLARTLTLIDGACRALDPDFTYDYEPWLDAHPVDGAVDLLRSVASAPATMHTMQQDMEEFQMRIVEEIDQGKRGAAWAAVLACAVAAHFFLT